MDGAQRGARAGFSGTIDNLLIDRTVTLDCHRRKGNLSRPWLVGGDNDPAQIPCLVIKDGREVKQGLEHKVGGDYKERAGDI